MIKEEWQVRQERTELPSGWFLIIRIFVLRWEVDVWIVWCLVVGVAVSVGIHMMCEVVSGMRKMVVTGKICRQMRF